MRARVDRLDWSQTPLGPRENWPDRLKFATDTVLASHFPMAIRWGPELVVIYNDAYREILGDKHPKALGSPLRDVFPEIYDQLGPLTESILRGDRGAFFADDHSWTIERHGRREDAFFTVNYSPIPDPTAATGVGGVLTIVIETTERTRAEARLHQLTHHLETEVQQRTRERDRVWQVSEDLLGVSTFEGYFISLNPAWTRLLGWSEGEIKSMHVGDLRHPDDAAEAVAGRALLANGVPTVRMENRFRHKNGSWCWIAWTMTADSGLIYVSGRHVSEEKKAIEALRESERQFRLLVAGVTDYALFMLDPNGIVSSWNAGAQRIKGYAADEIIGQHFTRFYTEQDRMAGVPDRGLETARKEGRFEAEGFRVRKDGTLFWANVILDAIYDDDGELVGFAKITRDITERRQAQSALQQAQAERAQLQKVEALGQLTGGVAHDFNNLLMIVSGHLQTLKKITGQEPRAMRAAEAIEIATQRGQSLTRQLLAFSRRQAVNPVSLDIAERIEAIRPMLTSSISSAVNLLVDIPPDTSYVKVDVSEFELALVNVTLNARDALPRGGVIEISARNVTLGPGDTPLGLKGKFVAIAVTDSGGGIPPDILPRVFDPFFTTKQVDKGTGLGLSQVHGFAHQSGGTVTITSELGKGTTVTLYLPTTDEDPEQAGDVQQREEPPGGTVLLVEDNPDVAELSRDMLVQLGYQVIHANDAERALALVGEHKVDLVLSDIVMAGPMDGLGLARAIRERERDLPIVLVTGYADTARRAATEFAVLGKPYQLGELSRAIARVLARSAPRA